MWEWDGNHPDDEELEPFERLLEDAKIRKRDDRIGRNDPQRADPFFEGSLDDVGIGETAGGGDRSTGTFQSVASSARSVPLSNVR